MFVVDTNLLLYAVNPDADEHQQACALIEFWRRDDRRCYVTWNIVYEFLRVSTHHKVFAWPLSLRQATEWMSSLMRSPNVGVLTPTDRHVDVLAELTAGHPRLRGNVVHDMHTVVLMREHGITEIRTADADFHQFRFLTVVNPLDSETA